MDLLGKTLGRYDLRSRLGKGGMATVYKAWDTNLERWVAVKVMHDYLTDEPDFRARFEREAKVVANLSHPNIVQVFDFALTEVDNRPIFYMVMAYIPGNSLKGIMDQRFAAKQPLLNAELLNVMDGTCQALAYAHGRDMVHRDVTPGNILFNEQGKPVLADFGIARIMSSARITQSGVTSGTPVYMAPEQGLGSLGDFRSDIYSLGVILFEMLTGRAPYDGESAFAVLLKHVNDPVPSLQAVNPILSEDLDRVVTKALAKNPEARYQSAMELLSAFRGAIGEASIMQLSPASSQPAETQAPTRVGERNRTIIMDTPPPDLLKAQAARRKRTVGIVALSSTLALAMLVTAAIAINRGATPPTTVDLNVPPVTTDLPYTLAVPPISTDSYAPSMTRGFDSFIEDFSVADNAYWPTTLDNPTLSRKIEGGAYRIAQRLPALAVTTIFYPSAQFGTQYQYSVDLTLCADCPLDTATGIVFRFRDENNYYVFAVNGSGQVSIWSRLNGQWLELRKLRRPWMDDPNVQKLGQVNRLTLIDDGPLLIGLINGKEAIRLVSEPVIESGAVGIYLASSTLPSSKPPYAEVTVDNFELEEYLATPDPDATGSGGD